MIELHRIGHKHQPFHLNPDLIVTIEATPDTVIGLTTGAKIVVAESPGDVAIALRDWRVEILSVALARPRPLRGHGELRQLREPSSQSSG